MRKKALTVILIMILGSLIYFAGGEVIKGFFLKGKPTTMYLMPVHTSMEGQSLPSIDLLLPDSTSFLDVNNVSPGKSIVLFYFGPHCPFCQAQTKEILKHITQLKEIQFYFLTPYPFNDMKNFIRQFQLDNYSNITIGIDYKFFVGTYFKINNVPFLAIYGKDKKLKGAFIGNVKCDQIKDFAEL